MKSRFFSNVPLAFDSFALAVISYFDIRIIKAMIDPSQLSNPLAFAECLSTIGLGPEYQWCAQAHGLLLSSVPGGSAGRRQEPGGHWQHKY